MPNNISVDIKKIIDLRMKLHRMPELSGKEYKTSEKIKNFIQKFNPSEIINIAETGLAIVFDSQKPGITTMFRAELDALPINEPEEIFNRSLIKNISHKCGHDGHMAILAGLAEAISKNPPQAGKVILLFQPAEETLSGAIEVMEDKNFKKIKPDFIFALHNLPNFPENSIIVKEGHFTSATNGITIKIEGNTSHAANPEKANNPTKIVNKLLNIFENIPKEHKFKDFVLITPVFVQIGSPDFGITPGNAEIKLTLRAFNYADLDKLIGIVRDTVYNIATAFEFKQTIEYTDDAPQILNHKQATNTVIEAAEDNNFDIIKIEKPFKWTDDFGYYTIKYKGCYFGIGAGNIPDLHNKMYEFPDNQIMPAIKLFYSIYSKTNK